MRLTQNLFSCLSLATAVVANNAFLYTFDVDGRNQHLEPIVASSSQGLSIIARRRENTDTIRLGDTTNDDIELLNRYAGFQQSIFDQGSATPAAKVFLQIEGHDYEVPHLEAREASLTIIQPTQHFDTHPIQRHREYCAEASDRSGSYRLYIDGLADPHHYTAEEGVCQPMEVFERQVFAPLRPLAKCIKLMADSCPRDESRPCSFASNFPKLIAVLEDLAATHQVQSTLLVTPTRQNLTTPSNAIYRRAEAPLDLPPASSEPDTEAADILAAPKPRSSNLPTCFASRDACMNSTNSCSGHGSCVKSVANSRCFQCKCHRTVVQTNPDGSKKYWDWGGKACEKKDVSVPFFLFASFGVVMASLIAGGIGLMYNMGSQELPSVLGAGVAGTRPQK